jgi:hypothetical protein
MSISWDVAFPLGVEGPGHETDYSLPSSILVELYLPPYVFVA